MKRCSGSTSHGAPCKRYPDRGSDWCWQHNPAAPERASEAVRRQWVKYSAAERKAIGERISRAKRGRRAPAASLAKRSATLKRIWSTRSAEEREAKIAAAKRKAQTPAAKRRRSEANARWREANPGAPGSAGLTSEQKVKLFFAAHVDATDEECAAAIGRSVHMVRQFRAAASRKPYKRSLLRKIATTTPHAEIVRALRGDRQLAKVPALLLAASSGKPLIKCYQLSGLSPSTGERVVETILWEVGGYQRGDWRGCNRYRRAAVVAQGALATPAPRSGGE